MTLAVLLLVSRSSGLDWLSQIPQPRRSQTTRQVSSYAPTFWLRSETLMSSNRQTTSRSSGTLRLTSNFAMLQKEQVQPQRPSLEDVLRQPQENSKRQGDWSVAVGLTIG
jgi:hypothetical protein